MTPAQRHKERVVATGCVIGRKWGRDAFCEGPLELHHIAEGSGKRSPFAVVCLCREHHTGRSGFHTLGTKQFCKQFDVPGETEYGLLVMANEYMARKIL